MISASSNQQGAQYDLVSSRRSSTSSFISQVLSTDTNAKLCIVCGFHFRKAQLPVHQKLCIRNNVRRRSSVISHGQGGAGEEGEGFGGSHTSQNPNHHYGDPRAMASPEVVDALTPHYYPCANCKRSFLQDKLSNHMKTCQGSAAPSRAVTAPEPAQPPRPRRQGKEQPPQSYLKPTFDNHTSSTYPPRSQPVRTQLPAHPYEDDFEQDEEEEDARYQQQQEEVEEPPAHYNLQSVVAAGEPLYQEVTNRVQCHICARKFTQDALQRHIPACEKLNLKKRPVYDSSKIRAKGTELEAYQRKLKMEEATNGSGAGLKRGKSKRTKAMPPPGNDYDSAVIPTLQVPNGSGNGDGDWRTKREQLVRNVRMSKQSSNETHSGRLQRRAAGMAAAQQESMIECAYCTRRFNEDAAERHIPICKASHEKAKFHGGGKSAAAQIGEALRRRNSFKPPPPKTKKKEAQPVVPRIAAPTPRSTSCADCGGSFATEKARFCFECGAKR